MPASMPSSTPSLAASMSFKAYIISWGFGPIKASTRARSWVEADVIARYWLSKGAHTITIIEEI